MVHFASPSLHLNVTFCEYKSSALATAIEFHRIGEPQEIAAREQGPRQISLLFPSKWFCALACERNANPSRRISYNLCGDRANERRTNYSFSFQGHEEYICG
jgi:hypothetical protein